MGNSAQLSERLDFSARGEGEPAPRSTLCKRCFSASHASRKAERGRGRQERSRAGRTKANLADTEPFPGARHSSKHSGECHNCLSFQLRTLRHREVK